MTEPKTYATKAEAVQAFFAGDVRCAQHPDQPVDHDPDCDGEGTPPESLEEQEKR